MSQASTTKESPAPNDVLCQTCGWTYGMICPECGPGCGCATSCTGWRHAEYDESEPLGERDGCECGPYQEGDCQCFDYR